MYETLSRVCRAVGVLLPLLAAVPAIAAQRYVIDHWTTDNGLPTDAVHEVSESDEGFVLLATAAGMLRFDGQSFTLLDETRIRSLARGTPLALLNERNGDFWIASVDGGLQYVSGRSAERIAPAAFSRNYSAVSVMAGVDGVIWSGTNQGLLKVRRTGTGFTSEVIPGTSARWVAFIAPDADGGVHFHDRGSAELNYLDAAGTIAASRWARSPSGKPVREFWTLADGRRLFSTPEGLHWNDGEAVGPPLAYGGGPAPAVFDLAQDRDGVIWVGTANAGVLRILPETPQQLAPFGQVPNDMQVPDVSVDSQGGVWLSTLSRGVYCIRRARVAAYGAAEGLAGDTLYTVVEGPDGTVWVGTNAGLFLRRRGHGRFEAYAELAGQTVSALRFDAAGRLLVSGRFGRLLRIGARAETFALPADTEPGQVYSIAPGTHRTLIGSTRGLYSFDGTTVTSLTELNAGGITIALAIVPDGDDDFWVGGSAGLKRFSKGRFVDFDGAKQLPEALVMSLYREPDGRLLIGYAHDGLAVLDRGKVAIRDPAHGFPSSVVEVIRRDGAGHYWLGTTGRGLYRIDRDMLLRDGYSRDNPMLFVWFGKKDGLPSEELRYQTVDGGAVDTGTLWFSTGRGLVAIDPVDSRPPAPALTIAIDRLLVDGEPVDAAGSVVAVPPGAKRIEIAYAIPSLQDRPHVLSQYRVSTLGEAWITHDSRTPIQLTNLRPGLHRLELRARPSDGDWGRATTALDLDVAQKFIDSLAFKLLVGSGIVVLIGVAVALRIQFLKLANAVLEERMRLASEFHDGLSQHFSAISLLLENARVGEKPPDVVAQQIDMSKSLAREGLRDLRRAIFALSADPAIDASLADALRSIGSEATQRCGTQTSVGTQGTPFALGANRLQHLVRIVQQLTANALEHGAATRIDYRIDYTGDALRLGVEDNGKGFDPQAGGKRTEGRGFGLISILDRARKIGAEVTIRSSENEGTSVVVVVPRRTGLRERIGRAFGRRS